MTLPPRSHHYGKAFARFLIMVIFIFVSGVEVICNHGLLWLERRIQTADGQVNVSAMLMTILIGIALVICFLEMALVKYKLECSLPYDLLILTVPLWLGCLMTYLIWRFGYGEDYEKAVHHTGRTGHDAGVVSYCLRYGARMATVATLQHLTIIGEIAITKFWQWRKRKSREVFAKPQNDTLVLPRITREPLPMPLADSSVYGFVDLAQPPVRDRFRSDRIDLENFRSDRIDLENSDRRNRFERGTTPSDTRDENGMDSEQILGPSPPGFTLAHASLHRFPRGYRSEFEKRQDFDPQNCSLGTTRSGGSDRFDHSDLATPKNSVVRQDRQNRSDRPELDRIGRQYVDRFALAEKSPAKPADSENRENSFLAHENGRNNDVFYRKNRTNKHENRQTPDRDRKSGIFCKTHPDFSQPPVNRSQELSRELMQRPTVRALHGFLV